MNLEILLGQAAHYMADGNYIDAEITLKKVLLQAPQNSRALKLTAELAHKCNRPDLAIKYYEEYLNITEPDLATSLTIAELFNKQNMRLQAGELLTHARELAPEEAAVQKLYLQHAYASADMDSFPCEKFIENKNKRQPGQIFFHTFVVVFGTEFTDLFLNYVLPTQLGPDNIEALNTEARSVYIIYTTPKDCRTIKKSPAFAEIAKIMDVRIYTVDFEFMNNADKYQYMIQSHKHALRKAHEEGARAIFIAPDAVFSESSFRNIFKRTKEGYKAIMAGTTRVLKEDFLPQMEKLFFNKDKIEAPINARDLINLAIKNIHPDTSDRIAGASNASSWPSQLLWEIPGEGLLSRNFHLHPLMIHPVEMTEFCGTIDCECVCKICKNIDDVYIAQDSDEMTGFDLSPKDSRTNDLKEQFSINYTAAWAEDYADAFHRHFVEHEIRFHNGKKSPKWNELSQEAATVVKRIKNADNKEEERFFPEVLSDYDLRFPPLNIDSVCFHAPPQYIHNYDVMNETWLKIFEELPERVSQTFCSNFKMDLNDEDCRKLSRFQRLQFNINASDCEKLDDGRLSDNLSQMLRNMNKIKDAARTENRPVPTFQWICVLTVKIVEQLQNIIELAASNNVSRIECLDILYFNDHELPVSSIFELKGEEFRKTIRQIEKARKLAETRETKMRFLPMWDDMVQSRLAEDLAKENFGVDLDIAVSPIRISKFTNEDNEEKRIYQQERTVPGPGETRACLAPWNSTYIMPNGDLHSCCIRSQVMGRFDDDTSIRKAMHSADYTDLRKQLITGNITDPVCLNCHVKEIIPLRELKRSVADMIRASMGK